jgi:small subunit ribosomal protein S8
VKYPGLKKPVGNRYKIKMKNTKTLASKKINYPIGDFLIRLKNAVIAGNKEVVVPTTKLIKSVSQVLKKSGFISEIKENEGSMSVTLAIRRKEPVLMDVRLISKPGLRIYMKVDELEKAKGPYVAILSTPLGIMTAMDAIKKKTGGELIARIY